MGGVKKFFRKNEIFGASRQGFVRMEFPGKKFKGTKSRILRHENLCQFSLVYTNKNDKR